MWKMSAENVMLNNQTLSELRKIALDETATASRRLASLDAIAASGNFWGTKRFPITQYVEPTERGRKFLRKALRRLLKSKKCLHEGTPQAVRSRLLFLKGIELSGHLHRLDSPAGQSDNQVAKPVAKVPDVVSEIEAFLAKHK